MTKIKWYLILFIALACFLIGLNTGELAFNIIAIILGFIVYRYGSGSILTDYHSRKEAQNIKHKQFQKALANSKPSKKGR